MENLIEKIKNEIVKTGYPTEMKIANTFNKRKWSIHENEYYIDQDELKGREIDLRSSKGYLLKENNIRCWSKLSIEIKKSQKPWVIFTSKKRFHDIGGYGLLHHTHNVTNTMLTYKDIMRAFPGQIERIGRSEYIPFAPDGHPQIYTAFISSIKSLVEMHRIDDEHKEAYSEDSMDVVFYTPVVILNGNLYEAYLNAEDEIEVEQTNHITFNLNYASPSYERFSCYVDVVTIQGLEEYIDKQDKWIRDMGNSIRVKAEFNV